ncbi:AMP-binding protein, partial [Halegenticoccus tardaugens]|uniref:AMP-binding protein n=1 Tax=Halegenticoccus tardaugens TaxID=2071624 RepID=UPI00100B4765
MTNLVTHVESAAEAAPESTAIGYDGREIDYRTFRSEIRRFSAGLADRGVGAGDRVAVYLPNLPQYVVAFHGTLHAGGIVVPMNPQYKAREIGHLLADSGATVVVALADLVPFVEAVRDDTDVEHVVSVGELDADAAIGFDSFLADREVDVVDRADDDVAVQPYTSGTTGRPKGVLLTHRNLAWNARTSAELMEGGVRPDDEFLGVLPLFHIYGMTVTMIATLFEGGSYHPLPSWDAQEALSLVEREGITVMHGVPAMYNDAINQPNAADFDLSSLRFVNSGGAGIPIEVLRRFEELYGVELYEGYGLTETSPVTHANRPGARRPGSIGQTLPGVEALVVDEAFEPVAPVERGPVDESEVDLAAITGELVIHGP